MLDQFCQHSSLPVFIVDLSGKLLKINSAFRDFWQVDSEKLFEADGYNLFSDPLLRQYKLHQHFQLAAPSPLHLGPMEYEFPHEYCREGQVSSPARALSILALAIPGEQDKPAIALCFYDESMSDRLGNAERKCEQLATLSRSALDLKHEINNPLLLIIGHTQLLMAKSDKLPGEVVRKLEKILSSAEKIRNIIQENQNLVSSCLEKEADEMLEL